MKIVIRAGGTGTRLWPLSRQHLPKQFQKVVGDQTMVRTTYNRIKSLLTQPTDIFVSVNQQLVNQLTAEIPELVKTNIIVETSTRNTGPAMCLEVCYLAKFCQPQEIIASLPSDDYISNANAFCDLLRTSADWLQSHPDYIIMLAVHPTYVDTGYTYTKIGQPLSQSTNQAIYQVADVVEKPNEERCQELIDSGVYYCHAGMYIWQLSTIIKLFQELQPTMYQTCQRLVGLMLVDQPDWGVIKEEYEKLDKMTIESAITHRAQQVAMSVSDKVGWSDVGKWHIIKRILSNSKENLTKGEVYYHNAKNNLVYNNSAKKIIVLNGVDDLVIVDTGDVLLVSSLDKSAEVKKAVEELKKQNKNHYL
ncbi:MAG: sugar phosphate nucleotidyltransferase [bacterium]